MLDALGQEIKEGWAAMVTPGRGSIYTERVYVIGTKGNTKVRYIGNEYTGTRAPEYNLYKQNPEEFPEKLTSLKVNTRIIMLGVPNEEL